MNLTGYTLTPNKPDTACTVCGVMREKHGSYPTCASHPYTPDQNCQTVLGATCVGAECRNGCVRARRTPPDSHRLDAEKAGPKQAPEASPDDELLRKVREALKGVKKWDESRAFIVPYRVRDPINSALAALNERLGQNKDGERT